MQRFGRLAIVAGMLAAKVVDAAAESLLEHGEGSITTRDRKGKSVALADYVAALN